MSRLRLSVESISDHGEGIARHGSKTIYIPGTVPGDEVMAAVGPAFARGSSRHPAKVTEFLVRSPDRRIAQQCPYQERCGGCPWGCLSDAALIRRKNAMLREKLLSAGVDPADDVLVKAFESECGWRTKSIRYFAAGEAGEAGEGDDGTGHAGHLIAGFFAPRSHKVVSVAACLAEPKWFSEFTTALCQGLEHAGAQAFDELKRTGMCRALMLREAGHGRMALFVAGEELSAAAVEALKKTAAGFGLALMALVVNSSPGNALIKGDVRIIYGSPFLETMVLGFRYRVAPQSFMQVNPDLAVQMYTAALSWCGSGAKALDLFCGAGAMTLRLSRTFREVTGVEFSAASAEAGSVNARLNGIDNVRFVTGAVAEHAAGLIDGEVDAVIADPPRAGLGSECVRALGSMKPGGRLCVIFCALAALVREIPQLCALGFEVCAVQGFDLFPRTARLETAVMLCKTE